MNEDHDENDETLHKARNLRVVEALLFASTQPVSLAEIARHVTEGSNAQTVILELQSFYAERGVNIVQRDGCWAFRTAEDLNFLLRRDEVSSRTLSRAALETLAIIAYHQPVTRAEIEEIRGVSTGKGTLDILMEAEWVKMRGRRRTPGRPVTYGTTNNFLDHFDLSGLSDLPGLEELKGAGLLSSRLPSDMQFPLPFDGDLRDDEDPLDSADSGDDDLDHADQEAQPDDESPQ